MEIPSGLGTVRAIWCVGGNILDEEVSEMPVIVTRMRGGERDLRGGGEERVRITSLRLEGDHDKFARVH